jgi:hypothetical protein
MHVHCSSLLDNEIRSLGVATAGGCFSLPDVIGIILTLIYYLMSKKCTGEHVWFRGLKGILQ